MYLGGMSSISRFGTSTSYDGAAGTNTRSMGERPMSKDHRPKHWQKNPVWQQLLAQADDPSQTLHGDVVIHTYQSRQDPYFTSSYFFDTERGVVLVDTQIFNTAAEELWEAIQAKTSGKLFAIVNTHAHPDHYFGNTLFRRVAPE